MPTDVGVRELKRDLSNYLKRAAAGEEIRVTIRGEPLVALVPVAAVAPAGDADQQRWEAEMEALYASGRVHRPLRAKSPWARRDFGITTDLVQAILDDRAAEDA